MDLPVSADSGDFYAELNHALVRWELDEGRLWFFGIRSALFWTNPSLLKLLQPLAAEAGHDLFRLMVAHSSSQGTSEDYHAMVNTLATNFSDGFLAWGRCVSAAGWGHFEILRFEPEHHIARVVVHNPWELSMQNELAEDETWGCPFLMGKVIGIFSHAFAVNCWADERIDRKESGSWVQFDVHPSSKTISDEIARLQRERMHLRERRLADEVEAQTLRLSEAQQRLEDYSRNLENRVEERTHELKSTLDELRQAQAQLVQSEKMAVLGQLVAGVAHEINNPLAAIQAAADELKQLSQRLFTDWLGASRWMSQDALVSTFLQKMNRPRPLRNFRERRALKRRVLDELEEFTDSDEIAQALVELDFDDDIDSIRPILQHPERSAIFDCASRLSASATGIADILEAVERASKTVFALKVYAHREAEGKAGLARLQDGVENVLLIYQNRLKYGIELIREYDDLPPLCGFHDELNQVWTNLIHNAIQAMDGQGTLNLRIRGDDQAQIVTITDSGCGMNAQVLQRIFEPFYTTKVAGEGSGLGLDIVRRIVNKHGGRISAESTPGQGAAFTVWLPLTAPELDPASGTEATSEEPNHLPEAGST